MEESDGLIAIHLPISRAPISPMLLHDKSRCLRDLLNASAFAIATAPFIETTLRVNFNVVREVLEERDSRNLSKSIIWKSIFSTNKYHKFTENTYECVNLPSDLALFSRFLIRSSSFVCCTFATWCPGNLARISSHSLLRLSTALSERVLLSEKSNLISTVTKWH